MYTYRNEFHNTSVRSRKSPAELSAIAERLATGHATPGDKRTQRSFHAALCGQHDCTCGDAFGCRPSRIVIE